MSVSQQSTGLGVVMGPFCPAHLVVLGERQPADAAHAGGLPKDVLVMSLALAYQGTNAEGSLIYQLAEAQRYRCCRASKAPRTPAPP